MSRWGPRTRLREVYAHPLGRDILDKVLLQMGLPTRLVDNPFIGRLRLSTVSGLSGGRVGPGFVESLAQLLSAHPDVPNPVAVAGDPPWWQEAVFYQIYPRSFAPNGDLSGIIDRLDHLEALGVDALWLSPIYDSPDDDNGYDIRDYRAIGAEYGTMADFDELLEAVHARGMRLIMDLVVNHTSDEHEWFQAALADPDSPYRDYYFFRGGSDGVDFDGVDSVGQGPPNNWTSFFSGPAWRWFPEADAWALHLFSAKQMDLNWDHEPVRDEVVDIVRWWLEKGVDGFRLDVINYISKQPGLPDGDEFVGELMGFSGVEHYFAGPKLHDHLRELRSRAFDPYGAIAVGETPGVGAELGKLLTGAERGELDLIFNFDHLEAPGKVRFDDYRYRLDHLRDHFARYQRSWGEAYQLAIFFDNHDNPRMVSKVDPRPEHRVALARLLATIQFTVRGTPFLYQGQEFGMVNQDFTSMEQISDIESINRYDELVAGGATPAVAFAEILAGTRDHARVPIPWDDVTDDDAVLSWHRKLIELRRESLALSRGSWEFTDTRRGRWVHRRWHGDDEVMVMLNLTDRVQSVRPPPDAFELVMTTRPESHAHRFGPYEARIYRNLR